MIVYTCLTGDHPIIPEQKQFESGIEYVFFHTHEIKNKHGKWQFIKIPIDKNELYTQRKHKILSHQLFDQPHAYFDTNTIFKPNLKNKLEECVKEKDFSVALHPFRKTYLDECCFLLSNKGIDYDTIIKMTELLKESYDFSKHVCILAGQIVRSTDQKVKDINTTWWNLWKQFESRDQLFLPPSVYKCKTVVGTFDHFVFRNRSKEHYTFWKKGDLKLLPKLINDISERIRNDK
jgi:hypothetical protein